MNSEGRTRPSYVAQLDIVGAGPAGLASAIVAAKAGLRPVVHEMRANVGMRLHGDFQGLENWTTEGDVLEELADLGIEPSFECVPIREQVCFDPNGDEHVFKSEQPFYYLVGRGTHAGTLDRGLRDQATGLGVELRFNDAVHHLPEGGIVAQGPQTADIIAVGYLFDTNASDGAYAVVDDRLAPDGYGYLLISKGRGTLASCIFRDFHNEAAYLEKTLAFFQSKVRFAMGSPRRFGGYGNAWTSGPVRNGGLLYLGESAGFQDALWGFGMRYAMVSGALAAKAIASGSPAWYDDLVRDRIRGLQRTSVVTRYAYAKLGDRGYRTLAHRMERSSDPRGWLRRGYAPAWWKRLAFPFARRSFHPKVQHVPVHDDCDCTWCQCHRGAKGMQTKEPDS